MHSVYVWKRGFMRVSSIIFSRKSPCSRRVDKRQIARWKNRCWSTRDRESRTVIYCSITIYVCGCVCIRKKCEDKLLLICGFRKITIVTDLSGFTDVVVYITRACDGRVIRASKSRGRRKWKFRGTFGLHPAHTVIISHLLDRAAAAVAV